MRHHKTAGLLIAAAAAITIGFAAIPHAAEVVKIDEAREAYRNGAYGSAHRQFLILAENGNATAKFYLGLMAHLGRGVPLNYGQSREWYMLAAREGDPRARNNLGVMYRDGLGTDPSPVLAYKWFSLAASAGNPEAINSLRRLNDTISQEEMLQGQQLAQEYLDNLKSGQHLVSRNSPSMPAAKVAAVEARAVDAPPKTPETAKATAASGKESVPGSSAEETMLDKPVKVASLNKPEELLSMLVGKPTYHVQLGLFATERNVDRVRSRLQKEDIALIDENVTLRDKTYSRLRIGPYDSEDKAAVMAARMNKIFRIRSVIVRQQ
jgi:cell division septation protein DedD